MQDSRTNRTTSPIVISFLARMRNHNTRTTTDRSRQEGVALSSFRPSFILVGEGHQRGILLHVPCHAPPDFLVRCCFLQFVFPVCASLGFLEEGIHDVVPLVLKPSTWPDAMEVPCDYCLFPRSPRVDASCSVSSHVFLFSMPVQHSALLSSMAFTALDVSALIRST